MKSYILCFSSGMGTQKELIAYLEQIPEIVNWRGELTNCFFLVSDENANKLTELLRKVSNAKGEFIICEASENRQGYLSKDGWRILRDKHLPGG
jgi:hypothetical protein